MGDMKERILLTALSLFARDGYEGVSVSDIADSLGVTKGALYRHYPGKRAIFDGILARMAQRDAEQARAHDLPEGPPEDGGDAYGAATLPDIAAFSKAMFRYWTEDAFAAPFRRMLTLEQYRSPEMGRLYQQYLVSGPMGYTAELFSALGLEKRQEKAAAFFGAMFLLFSVYDGAADKTAVAELLDSTLDHWLEQFSKEENIHG